MQVMPPTILQHMLTAAMTSPLGRVGGPPDALPAMLPPVPTPSSMSLNPAPLSTKSGSDEDDVPMRLHAAATATASATAHATAHAGVKVAVPAPLPPALAPLRTALETAVGSPVELAPARGVPCLVASQSHISLEFGAPATEHAFKMWFDASQAVVDHYLARAYALLLTSCMLVAVCCAGEIRAIALLIAMQSELTATPLPAHVAVSDLHRFAPFFSDLLHPWIFIFPCSWTRQIDSRVGHHLLQPRVVRHPPHCSRGCQQGGWNLCSGGPLGHAPRLLLWRHCKGRRGQRSCTPGAQHDACQAALCHAHRGHLSGAVCLRPCQCIRV